MSNKVLEVIFRLKDEFSRNLNQVEGKFNQFVGSLNRLSRQMKQFGNDLQHLGTTSLMLGAAITGPLLLAFNQASNYSMRVHNEIDKTKTVMTSWQISIAEAMVPVIEKFNNVLGNLFMAWERLGPQTQQALVQGALLAGAFLTLDGIVLKFVGSLLKAGSVLLKWGATALSTIGSVVAGMTPLTWGILAVVGAIALMIRYWEQVRNVALPVLNAIEIGANMVGIGFQTMLNKMFEGLIKMSNAARDTLFWLAQVPGYQSDVLLGIADKITAAQPALRAAFTSTGQTITDLEKNIEDVFSDKGKLAGAVDSGMTDIRFKISGAMDFAKDKFGELNDFMGGLSGKSSYDFKGNQERQKDMQAAIQNYKTWGDIMRGMATDTAQAMSRSFSDGFFNLFTGQLSSIKDMFADFGRSVLRILADVMAKLLITRTLGAAFPAFNLLGTMHAGGVVRAHSGLAVDEVPIIAQSGEGIISRRGMAAMGTSSFARMNRGENVGGGVVNNFYINAVDAPSFQRLLMQNGGTIAGIVGQSVQSNSSLRDTLRRSM